jgi:CHAT domain-containing protein/tetratricopeptide (TPR) repeat protein
MRVRAKTLAWLSATVGLLAALGLLLHADGRRLRSFIAGSPDTTVQDSGAWRGPMERAEYALSQGEEGRALALADSAWQTAILGQDSSDFAVSTITFRDSVGRFLYWPDAAEAESLMVRIRHIRESVLGPDHPDLAHDWHDIAILYDRQWRHYESLPFHRRMLEIREASLDPVHPDVVNGVIDLANHCEHLGRYAEAESLFMRGVELSESLYRPRVQESDEAAGRLSRAYDELGHVRDSQGKYAEAEGAYRRSLAIRESTYGVRRPEDVGASLGYLGGLYWTLGQHIKAEAYFKRSLQMREAGLGPDHPDVASSLSSLAMVKAANREYEEAERLYKRVLDIRSRTIALDTPDGAHPGIAMSLNSLGWIYTCQGRYAEAESLYREAIDIWNKAFGYEHPRSVGVIEDLGYNYVSAGDYDAAEQTYARALDIIDRTLGPDHPQASGILEALSGLSRVEDRPGDAVPVAERAIRIRLANFTENALILEEADALSFSRSLARSRNNLISCLLDADMIESHTETMADVILATKGPVSDEMFERLRGIASDTDSTTQVLMQKLRDAKFQLSSLWMARPGQDSAAYRARLDRIEMDIEDLDRQIADRTSGRRPGWTGVAWQTISDRLPKRAILIEYLRWEYLDPVLERSVPRYLALVLRRGAKPDVVMLGDAAAIDSVVSAYRKHMDFITAKHRWPSSEDRRVYGEISDKLYGLILKPLEEMTCERTTLMIAPDGVLNLVSFPGLLGPDGSYLVESHTIVCLSSGRDLERLDGHGPTGTGLLAMADPDLGTEKAEAQATEDNATGVSDSVTHRSGDYGLAARDYVDNTDLDSLPGAREEAARIASLWSETCSEPLAVYVGADATEQRFKAEASGKRMIHLATHGFVLRGEEDERSDGTGVRSTNLTNPLLMTGLFLAGSKTRGEEPGAEELDDGILTAYEVSAMDLSGVELVVLSACETGLGTMQDGEGVYGLSRAFQYAGARTVISTLWPLPDKAGARLMDQIYAETDGPLPERLRCIQVEMLASQRAAGESDHPYTWAGLTLTGTWGY